jgi:hypothetical protein
VENPDCGCRAHRPLDRLARCIDRYTDRCIGLNRSHPADDRSSAQKEPNMIRPTPKTPGELCSCQARSLRSPRKRPSIGGVDQCWGLDCGSGRSLCLSGLARSIPIVGNAYASRKAIRFFCSCTARDSLHGFCRNSIICDFVQTCSGAGKIPSAREWSCAADRRCGGSGRSLGRWSARCAGHLLSKGLQ